MSTGVAPGKKGDTVITSVPSDANANPAQPIQASAGPPSALQITAANAMNQTATERSTCTISAERKNSFSGKTSWMPGVRENTSSSASRPEPISAMTPSQSQARASEVGAPGETRGTNDSTENALKQKREL